MRVKCFSFSGAEGNLNIWHLSVEENSFENKKGWYGPYSYLLVCVCECVWVRETGVLSGTGCSLAVQTPKSCFCSYLHMWWSGEQRQRQGSSAAVSPGFVSAAETFTARSRSVNPRQAEWEGDTNLTKIFRRQDLYCCNFKLRQHAIVIKYTAEWATWRAAH